MKFEGKLSEKTAAKPSADPPVETISQLLLSHAQNPKNIGEVENPNGMAVGFGSCGDSLVVQLLVSNGIIQEIKYIPDGCLYTVVCASMMSDMVKGLPLDEALKVQPEDIDTLLGGLPSDHLHCARLAVNTLGEAIEDYHCRNGFPDDPGMPPAAGTHHQRPRAGGRDPAAAGQPDKGKEMAPVILIATEERDRFFTLADALKKQIDPTIHWAVSGSTALIAARNLTPLLVIIDEALPDMSGLDFARELLKTNAFVNIALVSGLSPEEFHKTTEGLGVLVQLPFSPEKRSAEDIVSGLKRVFALPPNL